jgi:hypothetical protein
MELTIASYFPNSNVPLFQPSILENNFSETGKEKFVTTVYFETRMSYWRQEKENLLQPSILENKISDRSLFLNHFRNVTFEMFTFEMYTNSSDKARFV